MIASVSTSKLGIVARDSDIRRAISCWTRVGSWVSKSSLSVAGGFSVVGGFAATGGLSVTPAAVSTSARVIRPRGPLPLTCSSSTPWVRATRLASGVALGDAPVTTTSSPAGSAPLDGGGGVGTSPAGGTSPRSAGAPSPPSSAAPAPTRAITSPTGTLVPSSTTIWTAPAISAACVTVALSVSISTRSSPASTVSPSCFSHRRIVPSSIESDSLGIVMSVMGLPPAGRARRRRSCRCRCRSIDTGRPRPPTGRSRRRRGTRSERNGPPTGS